MEYDVEIIGEREDRIAIAQVQLQACDIGALAERGIISIPFAANKTVHTYDVCIPFRAQRACEMIAEKARCAGYKVFWHWLPGVLRAQFIEQAAPLIFYCLLVVPRQHALPVLAQLHSQAVLVGIAGQAADLLGNRVDVVGICV